MRGAADDGIALTQSAGVDEHGRDGAAALVELGLDRDALCTTVRVRLEHECRIRREEHGFEQLVDALALECGDRDEHRLAAVLLRHEVVLGQLLHDLLRVGALLVDLVHRHHDRHIGRLRVVQRLDRLRHDAVVRCDHEDRDVRRLRTAGSHRRERFVARGVQERDRTLRALVLDVHLVRTDVLCDAAGLAAGHVGGPHRVERLGLAVVDVAHDGDDRRAGAHVLFVALLRQIDVEGLEELAVLVLRGHHLDLVAELVREDTEGGLIERRGDRRHLAQVEEDRDEVRRIGVDLVREVRERRTAAQAQRRAAVSARDRDAADRRSLHLLELCALRPLRLASACRTSTAAAECALRIAATATGAATGRAATGTPPVRRCSGGTARRAAGTAAGSAPTAGAGLGECRVLEHPRVGARNSGAGSAAAGLRRCAGTRSRSAGTGLGARLRTRLGHALGRSERIVARTAAAGTARSTGPRLGAWLRARLGHALGRSERIVAGTAAAGLRRCGVLLSRRRLGSGLGTRLRSGTRLRGRCGDGIRLLRRCLALRGGSRLCSRCGFRSGRVLGRRRGLGRAGLRERNRASARVPWGRASQPVPASRLRASERHPAWAPMPSSPTSRIRVVLPCASYASVRRRTIGASTVDDAERTYSPIS